MNQLNHSFLSRSFAKLAENPELKALETSLVTTLRGLVAADSVLFHELRTRKNPVTEELDMYLLPITEGSDHEQEEPAPVLLTERAGFRECLAGLAPVVVPIVDAASAPRLRFIHPVTGARGARAGVNGVVGFIVMDAAEQVPRDQELITVLLGFYRNYAALLQENQRDHLTGLLNRKSFDGHMMKIILSLSDISKRKADKIDYCLAVLDIDHFKDVRNAHGHLMGDEVLLHFSQCMNSTFRDYDLLFRFGGEEFVVVLKDVSPDLAKTILGRFRSVVENHYFPQAGKMTTSIGITTITGKDLPVTIIDRADQALHYAKSKGGSQICLYEALLAENKLANKAASNDIELF